MADTVLQNFINGQWCPSSARQHADVHNPATGELLARVPLSPAAEVDQAAQAAHAAYLEWRRVPAPDRIQYLFKLKDVLEEHIDELSRLITDENGKTFAEAKGEMRRAIENVEVACGIPLMMQGDFSEVNLGLTAEAAAHEAERCLSCGTCIRCDTCLVFCPDVAIARAADGGYTIAYDYCKGCGVCAEECPRAALSMEEEGQ